MNTQATTQKLTDIEICQALLVPGATLASVGNMIGKSEQDMSKAKYKNFAPLICNLQEANDDLQSQVANLQAAEKDLQASNAKLQATNKQLQSQVANLQAAEKDLQTSNAKLQDMQEELATAKKDLDALCLGSEQAIIPKYLNGNIDRYLGELTTGNVVVSIVNAIECCSLFSCSVYIMPTLVLGIICGIMLSSVLWYAQSIIKNPKYIGVSAEFMTVAFFVMCLSMSAHYAAISKNGGVIIEALNSLDITIVVSIVIPAISFASLYLRNAQAQLDE